MKKIFKGFLFVILLSTLAGCSSLGGLDFSAIEIEGIDNEVIDLNKSSIEFEVSAEISSFDVKNIKFMVGSTITVEDMNGNKITDKLELKPGKNKFKLRLELKNLTASFDLIITRAKAEVTPTPTPEPENELMTIKEVQDNDVKRARIRGKIMAKFLDSLVVADSTGAINVLINEADVKIGDDVELSGEVNGMGEAKRIFRPELKALSYSKPTYPEAFELTNNSAQGFLEGRVNATYFHTRGTLVVDDRTGADGTRVIDYIIELSDTLKLLVNGPESTEIDYGRLEGSVVDIYGYITMRAIGNAALLGIGTKIERYEEPEPVINTINEVLTTDIRDVRVRGSVMATHDNAFVIADDTGAILVYVPRGFTAVAGDLVEIACSVSTIYNGKMLDRPEDIKIIEKATRPYPAPIELDSTTADAFLEGNVRASYAHIRGMLEVIDERAETGAITGHYYHIKISDTLTLSFSRPKNLAFDINTLDGKIVDLNLYVTGRSMEANTLIGIGVAISEYAEPALELSTIDAVITSNAKKAKVRGIVMAITDEIYVIADDTGSIQVFVPGGWNLSIGDYIELTGTVRGFGEAREFYDPEIELIERREAIYPDSMEVNMENINIFQSGLVRATYAHLVGDLLVEEYTNEDGITYYTYKLYLSESQEVCFYEPKGLDIDINTLNGKRVDLYLYITGRYNDNKTLQGVGVKISEAVDPALELSTIDAVIKSNAKKAKVRGIVMAITDEIYVIADDTGSIQVFVPGGWNLSIGDYIELTGTVRGFGEARELYDPEIELIERREAIYPDPMEVNMENINTFQSGLVRATYAHLVGDLLVEEYTNEDGITYYTYKLYLSESQEVCFYEPKGLDIDINTLNGKRVDLYLYITGRYNDNKTLQGVGVKISEVVDLALELTTINNVLTTDIKNAKVRGNVMAITESAFIIEDETAAIVVYVPTGWNVAIGDLVEVAGMLTMLGHGKMFNEPTIERIERATKEYPTPIELNSRAASTFLDGNVVATYAHISGMLEVIINRDAAGAITGYNYHISINDTLTLTFTEPIGLAFDIKKLDGKQVDLKLYITARDTKNTTLIGIGVSISEIK